MERLALAWLALLLLAPEATHAESFAALQRTLMGEVTQESALLQSRLTASERSPDDFYKRDNHTNARGFQDEGEAFLAWAAENVEGLMLVTGDRHWQYHSIHPTGIREFSSGALHDENARLGTRPRRAPPPRIEATS